MPNPENVQPHKFKPGKSGNPEGRPKGSRNLSTILREMLEEEIPVEIDGKKERKQFKDLIIRRLLKSASTGDVRAIREIFDRLEGKAHQSVAISPGEGADAFSHQHHHVVEFLDYTKPARPAKAKRKKPKP